MFSGAFARYHKHEIHKRININFDHNSPVFTGDIYHILENIYDYELRDITVLSK